MNDRITIAPRPARRWARRLAAILLVALLVNVAVTMLLSATVNPFEGAMSSLTTATALDDDWTVIRFERPGATAVISEVAASVQQSWSQRQACGPPNTPTAGDQVTAWASSTTDGQIEWLELDYATAVRPSAVHVVETYNPGALFKVDVYQADGTAVTAWEGTDPTPVGSGMGISVVPVSVDFPTQKVRIWLDSPKVSSWNEIDAVGLADTAGNLQWAVRARASSVYGQSRVAPPIKAQSAGPSPADLLPSYGGFDSVSEGGDAPDLGRRVIAGFGWPFVSLWAPLPEKVTVPAATVAPPVVFITGIAPTAPVVPAPPAYRPPLPWRPAWAGLAINTLLYSVVVAILYWLAVKPRQFIVEVGRIRRGACRECGYDLGYDFIQGCPECGWRREEREQHRNTDV